MVSRPGDAETAAHRSRAAALQHWLSGRADTSLGRLALEWFRAYFDASRNSGCAATVHSALSVLPAALVAVAFFHSSGDDTNAFAERLITQLRLTGSTASLVHDTFGAPPATDSRPRSRSSSASCCRASGSARSIRSCTAGLADPGRIARGRPGAVRGLPLRPHGRDRPRSRLRRRAPRGRMARRPARLADRLDGVLALGAALPPPPQDRARRPPPRRPPRLARARRHRRRLAVLPAGDPERERYCLRRVRHRPDGDRLRVRDDHDLALVCAVFSPAWVGWRQAEKERRAA
jgi:hypothetical protein